MMESIKRKCVYYEGTVEDMLVSMAEIDNIEHAKELEESENEYAKNLAKKQKNKTLY